MRKLLLISATLCLTACAVKTPIVSTPAANCAALIPAENGQPVQAAPVPISTVVTYGTALTPALEAAIIAPWAAAYVATSGALDKANGRTADTVQIVKGCEARMNAARPR